MTIAIAIAVPDGIALAADTQTTWQKIITKVKEKGTDREIELSDPISVPIGWSKMAKKLFALKFNGEAIAICSAGLAIINSKTMYSVFKSFEKSYSGPFDLQIISQYLVDGITEELKAHHNVSDLSLAPESFCHFIIAGFEQRDVSKPFLERHLVFSGTANINRKKDSSGHFCQKVTSGINRYQGCWIGREEFISHVVKHSNKGLPPLSGQYYLMSLADALDYTKFLVEFTCDFQRFAVMVPDCGRPIISAVLTPDGYEESVME